MTILSRHPYSFLFAGVGIVLVVAVLSVHMAPGIPTAPAMEQPNSSNYLPLGEPASETIAQPTAIEENVPILGFSAQNQRVVSSAQTAGTSPSATNGSQPNVPTPQTGDSNSLDALGYAYSIFSTNNTTTAAPKQQTPEQIALHAYGNEAGLAFLTFENAHPDMVSPLKAWLTASTSASAALPVRQLGEDMEAAGDSISNLQRVPNDAAGKNAAFGSALHDAGATLIAATSAGGNDANLKEALLTYNAAADSFTAAYLALSDLFSINNVSFSAGEAGSVFQFASAH